MSPETKPSEGVAPATSLDASQPDAGNAVDLGYQPDARAVLGPLTKKTALIICLCCLPLLLAFFCNLWGKPAFRFYPVALLGGFWLMRRGWRTLRAELRPGSGRMVIFWLGCSLLWLVVSAFLWAPWGGAVGALLALAGMIWWLGGWTLFRAMLPGLLMLAVVVRPPLGLDTGLLESLGLKLLKAASRMLYQMSVPHFLSSKAVELPGMKLAFSDITSLTNVFPSLIAFSLLYALWRRRSVVRIILALAVAPAFPALLVSAAMILGIRMSLADHFNVFAGMRGVAIQAAIFVICAGMAVSFDEFLTFIFAPVLRSRSRSSAAQQVIVESVGPKMFPESVGSRRTTTIGVVFAAVGLVQLVLGGLFYARLMQLNQPMVSRIAPQTDFSLPAKIGDWKQVEAVPLFLPDLPQSPTQLKIWYFELGDLGAAVRLEYPQRGFVNPVREYEETGWAAWLETARPATAETAGGMEAEMQRNWVQSGSLWVGAFDEAGRWLPMPGTKPVLFERFKPRVSEPVVSRIQVLGCGRETMDPKDRARVSDLFQAAGRELNSQVRAQLKNP